MGAVAIQQMADRVAALMEERLRLRGQGLEAKLKRGGRALPRRVRDAASRLAVAAHHSQNPKLLLQIDEERVAQDYDICLRHLGTLGQWDRRRGVLLRITASVLLPLLVVMGGVIAVLRWRGFI